MWVVVVHTNVLEAEIINFSHTGIDPQRGEWTEIPAQLLLHLLHVVRVNVQISERVDEFAGFQSADLGHHGEQDGVRGDVEWHAEEEVGAALIKLATQRSVLANVKLKKGVAGCERHVRQVRDVPRADDQPSAVGGSFDLMDHVFELIMNGAIRPHPLPPLFAVNRPQASVFFRPFVPDGNPILLEVAHIGVALNEPQKLVDDGL